MPLSRYALAFAASVLLAGAAYAAGETPSTPADQAPPEQPVNPPDTGAAQPPPADTMSSMPPAAPAAQGSDVSAMSASSAGTNTVAMSGIQVVASAPVPDTPENRAKYGGPMSRAGKRTAPNGN